MLNTQNDTEGLEPSVYRARAFDDLSTKDFRKHGLLLRRERDHILSNIRSLNNDFLSTMPIRQISNPTYIVAKYALDNYYGLLPIQIRREYPKSEHMIHCFAKDKILDLISSGGRLPYPVFQGWIHSYFNPNYESGGPW